MRTRRAVGAFVVNKDGKFLILKTHGEKESYWDIPKGGVEEGESLVHALKRELKEETGIGKLEKIKRLGLNFTFEFPDEVKNRVGFDCQKVELFLVHFSGSEGDIRVDGKEITDFKFVDEKEFIRKVSYETTREAFKIMMKNQYV
jgi:putative (di)nucleoside polyphosphate hydrolase